MHPEPKGKQQEAMTPALSSQIKSGGLIFHKVMSCFGSHWSPKLLFSRALGIRVDRRLLPSSNPLAVCPGNGRFSKYLLALSLHLELVLYLLGDPGVSQNPEKITP